MVRAVITGLVFFHYDDGSRSQETARNLLEPFKGYLQSDGYAQVNPREWLTNISAWLLYYARDKGKDLKELLPNYWKLRNSKEI